MATDDTLEELARFRHHEPQAVKIDEHFEEFRPFEVLDRVRQFATFPQGSGQIRPRLGSTFGRCRKLVHAVSPFI